MVDFDGFNFRYQHRACRNYCGGIEKIRRFRLENFRIFTKKNRFSSVTEHGF